MTSGLLLLWLFVLIGAVLQGSVGIGQGLFAAPLIALVDPRFVPGPLLACVTMLVVLMVVRDRRSLDSRGVLWGLAGRFPGAIVGASLLTALTGFWLDLGIGSMILLCVLLSFSKLRLRPRPGSLFAAGFVSGITGTTAAVGGPPMALVLQHEEAKRLRGTLSGYFLVGTIFSLSMLSLAGRYGTEEIRRTLALLPAVVVGFLISNRLAPKLKGERLRYAILALSGFASLLLILRGLRSALG